MTRGLRVKGRPRPLDGGHAPLKGGHVPLKGNHVPLRGGHVPPRGPRLLEGTWPRPLEGRSRPLVPGGRCDRRDTGGAPHEGT